MLLRGAIYLLIALAPSLQWLPALPQYGHSTEKLLKDRGLKRSPSGWQAEPGSKFEERVKDLRENTVRLYVGVQWGATRSGETLPSFGEPVFLTSDDPSGVDRCVQKQKDILPGVAPSESRLAVLCPPIPFGEFLVNSGLVLLADNAGQAELELRIRLVPNAYPPSAPTDVAVICRIQSPSGRVLREIHSSPRSYSGEFDAPPGRPAYRSLPYRGTSHEGERFLVAGHEIVEFLVRVVENEFDSHLEKRKTNRPAPNP